MSKITRTVVSTKNAAKPLAPYNQAIIAGRTVYLSGCLGLDKDTLTLVPGGAGPEMKKALENAVAILEAAGSSVDKVVKTMIYVDDLKDFGAINEEYKKVFNKDFPARSCVQTAKIGLDAKVEFEVIAVTGDVKTITIFTRLLLLNGCVSNTSTELLKMSHSTRAIISTNNAAKPLAPYNQAIVADRMVYVSGCLGLDKETLSLVPGGAGPEMRKALENMVAILKASGSSAEKVVKTMIFVSDLNDFGAINEEYKKVFTKDYPARSCVQIAKIGLDAKVELEVIALTGDVEFKTISN
ncbi:RutC family protein [Pseudolycoriella hygida]|uniref:RutC family protein n=1 Tax=Pseudolycoriella hygida TaxID=35572 RepID=A0A9Q0MSJ2_9DIPT|nr:RutC family protein [Pseudolycoriella hygida]